TKLVALRVARSALPQALERVWAKGNAALPLDPELPDRQVRELVGKFKPHEIETGEGITPLPDGRPVDPGIAVVLATSGTTGSPKGVELGWNALACAAELTNDAVGADAGDRWLCCLPPSQTGGFMTLFRSRALGTRAKIHERFEPERIASESDCRFISLVPTMLGRLLASNVDLTHFDALLVGGDRADPSLLENARERGARVISTYGMTETCGGIVYDGRPLPGVEVTLGEADVIQITSPTLMRGYRLDDDSTDRALVAERFITSDRGDIDDEGRLRMLGRVDDVIISAGNKIVRRRLEDALAEHPAIDHASVTAIPDPELG
ncbi:MAG: AMP-binding protein, partial [Actinobacteria bacterium]|nr:AMP-binding protein [Actinomycetota bacterium]